MLKRTPLAAFLVVSLLLAGPAAAAEKSAVKDDSNSPTVAVLYFDYSGKNEEMMVLKKGLAAMLISDLSDVEGVRIVERDRIEEILAELKLGQTKMVDKKTAAKIGKLLGARYMVMGTFFDMMGALRADARVVEVETGRIVKSVGSTGKPGEFMELEQQLSTKLEKVLATELPSVPAPKPKKKTPKRKRARKKPKKMKTKLALRYSKALDAKDKGDEETAKKELKEIVKEEPEFQLAANDLAKMVR